MKKVSFKIRRGLKGALIAFSLLAGATALTGIKNAAKVTMAIAPIGLVAKAKKLNPNLTEEEEAGFKAIEESVSECLKGLATADDVNSKIDAAKAGFASKSEYDELLATVKEQGRLIDEAKSMANKRPEVADPSVKAFLKSWLETPKPAGASQSNAEKLAAFKRGEISRLELGEFKAAGTMTSSNYTDAQPYIVNPQVDPGVTTLVRTQPRITQYLTTVNATSETCAWVEQVNPDGQCAFIGEGVLKPLVDFDFKKNTSNAKKVAARTKATKEALDDVAEMAGLIETELRYQVDITEDEALLTGDGIGDNLKGIDAFAGGYVLTTIQTVDPNLADCIMAAAVQIRTLNFNANVALVNPVDVANLTLKKASNGHYLIPPFQSADGMTIAGITVVECNNVEAGTIRVYDSSKAIYRPYESFMIAYGWVNDDFEKNLVSVIGEKRVHFYIKENYTGAFVSDTIANIKAAITEPAV